MMRSKRCLRDAIIPLDKLMIETDSPYMGFKGNKDSFFEAEGDSGGSMQRGQLRPRRERRDNIVCRRIGAHYN